MDKNRGGDAMPNINIKLKRENFNDVYFPYLFKYDKRYEVYYGGA